MSMILHGRPLMTTCPFFRRDEHCMLYVSSYCTLCPLMQHREHKIARFSGDTHGKVLEAPAPAASKVSCSSSDGIF